MYRVLILGGYGNFGTRIAKSLAQNKNIQLIVAGRNTAKAEHTVSLLERNHQHEAVGLDQFSDSFVNDLVSLNVDCLIHTSGPYQQQSYLVAEACIQTNTHYIDLADGREFVANFSSLNEQAKEKKLLLVSGASTLPGLSSAVFKEFEHEFNSINSVRICISPGNQAPRGESTIAAVLSYCGKPIKCWVDGEWQTKYGWQDLHSHNFPALGKRRLGLCDVPDLSLFPKYYPNVKTILFHAALETAISQLGFWSIAAITRVGLIKYPDDLAIPVYKLGEWMNFMGSPHGGMFVILEGKNKSDDPMKLSWYLTALNGHGPEIPTIPAIVIAKKLARDEIQIRGAMPCFKLITLKEFDNAVSHLDISWEVKRS